MKTFICLLGLICSIFLGINTSFSCTDFRLRAKDGTVLITRSMEFAMDLHSNLRSSPRGRLFKTTAPDGKNAGLSWKAKYGYVFLDALDQDLVVDGMNEEGLSFEALYLPVFAQYQTVPSGHPSQALPYTQIGAWILSQFKTVDEIQSALSNIYIFEQKMADFNNLVFPLHFAVTEATGKGLIIEYVKGELHLYDNSLGVLTNSPTYDWHLTNLNNYIHLRPINPSPILAEGIQFAATGQGFGMIGLPGDISPPSRFVKMAVLAEVALPADDAKGVLNLAEHLINNVDIPLGLAREPQSGKFINELTQWVVFKDLSHQILYYRTYANLTLHAVSLAKIDFSEKASPLKMPIASPEYVLDLTDLFLKSK